MATIEEKRKARRKQTGEDFTPAALVNEILDQLPAEVWTNPEKTWLDPAAGNGNFLVEVKRRLMEAGHSEEHILRNMIFAADLMPDNCEEMILRLYGPGTVTTVSFSKMQVAYKTAGIKYCFKHNGNLVPNIVCADGLKYDYSFGRKEVEPVQALFEWQEG
jgi:hypothetical protein